MATTALKVRLIEAVNTAIAMAVLDDDSVVVEACATRAIDLAENYGYDHRLRSGYTTVEFSELPSHRIIDGLVAALPWMLADCSDDDVLRCEHGFAVDNPTQCHFCDPAHIDDGGLWQTVKRGIDALVGQRIDNCHDMGIADVSDEDVFGYLTVIIAHGEGALELIITGVEYTDVDGEPPFDLNTLPELPRDVAVMAIEYLRAIPRRGQ